MSAARSAPNELPPSLLSGEEMTAHDSFFCRLPRPACVSDRFISALFRYAAARAFKKFAVLIRLSAMTPSPTQRAVPSASRYRHRRRPCRRLSTLMRPSQPTRQRCPRRNQRCRSCARRAGVFPPGRGKIDAPNTTRQRCLFILPRGKATVRRGEIRCAAEDLDVPIERGVHSVMSAGRVAWTS